MSMRWVLITFESLATGILATVASFIALIIGVDIYFRYARGMGSNQAVGWDPVSFFGQRFGHHWMLAAAAIPLGVFLCGCSAGLCFSSQRVHRTHRT